MPIQTVNPATGEVTHTYQEISNTEADNIIEQTYSAYLAWRDLDFSERSEKLQRTAELLSTHTHDYAKMITAEMGKPITAARKEIEKCARVCRYYAAHAVDLLQPRYVDTDMQKSMVVYRPLGIIFAIMPWNYPFWQVFRFVAPNLMAGNAALLSHAPICTRTGLAIEALLREAGFPEHLFRTVVVSNDTAKHIIEQDKVRAVTLTGSSRAGKAVGAEAAGALKKVVLELGGSDPYLILEDADLEKAAEACVASRMNNSGQVCIAAKRIIVLDAVRDTFEKLVIEKMARYQMGDPTDETCNFGPMAREDLRAEVHRQVQICIDQGAELIMGGKMPDGPGFYYPPTLLTNIKKGMPAREEEIFGPVLVIINAKDEAEAIAIANDSQFGLAGAVFTQDIARGEAIATDKIHTGTCYVNGLVSSDPRLPFGGIHASGYGRELSAEGIREFVNTKTICVVA